MSSLGDHVAEVHAHAEGHAPVFGQVGILAGQLLLRLDRALHRVDRARELDQQAVAGGTDDASMELRDLGLDHLGYEAALSSASVPDSSAAISRE